MGERRLHFLFFVSVVVDGWFSVVLVCLVVFLGGGCAKSLRICGGIVLVDVYGEEW
jgi:hypothetical protein